MMKTLVRADSIAGLDDQVVTVRYFALRTVHGTTRYSADIVVGPGDHIILDDDSMSSLEAKANCLVPATLYSRALAGRRTAA